MGLITLQDIFSLGYPDYERSQALPAHVRKAARAIMQCRTAALGGHVQACPDGHVSRIWYNSCRGIGRVPNVPSSRSSAGARPNGRACWPVTIIM